MFQKKRGFTLIEMLIVISIIAGFVAILYPNLMEFRIKSRDSRRKSDLKQIQKALELYKLDQYPPSYRDSLPVCNSQFSSGLRIYMQKIPCDPQGGSYFYTRSDELHYYLYACLENATDPEGTGSCGGNTCSSGKCYRLTEP